MRARAPVVEAADSRIHLQASDRQSAIRTMLRELLPADPGADASEGAWRVLTREADFVESVRTSCGYVLTIAGKRFLHPGDSVLTEEHLGQKAIDVLFVSPTVHNMYVDRSMMLINRLQPAYVFPQHFGTFRETDENRFWTKGYPDELKLRLSADLQRRYHQLEQGQKFVIEFQAPRFRDGKKVSNARFVKVTLNDQVIHENVEMKGPTPSGLTGREAPTGPVLFQGDHGPVAFRTVRVTPREAR